MNFLKSKADVLPSVLMALSIIVLLGSLVVMVAVPKPSTAGLARGKDRSRLKVEEEIEQAKQRHKETQAAVAPRLWSGDPETVTASVLAKLTQEASGRKLQVGAFRPQKPQTLSGVTELPYSLQVSGGYPQVRGFLSTLDAPGSKLALRSIQVAAADANTSTVTATLGVSAYLETKAQSEKKNTEESTARPAPGGTRG
ncbi:MAG TPA: type 4a pilus biogenesis protein PilO [Armatimonadaceae bacterium]|nr:type 4a pilus biogenesis protein PilO [Armatimonadaceae bacterium]